jgi:hypothetical protein
MWSNLGAEAVIPKWDPRKHKAHSMDVSISISFDKKDRPQNLYCSQTKLQEPFIIMVDYILIFVWSTSTRQTPFATRSVKQTTHSTRTIGQGNR